MKGHRRALAQTGQGAHGLQEWAGKASLVAQMVKHPPAMQETWVRSLGQEDSLEKGMATHSGILAWKIPWPEEPGRLQSMGPQGVRRSPAHTYNARLKHFFQETLRDPRAPHPS